jgi:hypothetical protein
VRPPLRSGNTKRDGQRVGALKFVRVAFGTVMHERGVAPLTRIRVLLALRSANAARLDFNDVARRSPRTQ